VGLDRGLTGEVIGANFPADLTEKLWRRHGLIITDRWMKQTADVETPKRLLDRDDLDSFKRRAGRGWKNLDNIWRYNVGLRVGEALEWMSRQILPTSRISPRSTTGGGQQGPCCSGLRGAKWARKLFRPQDSKGKTRNLLCICPFPASVYIFSLYSDDETQDVVGRLCAHDLECFGYSFHK
jgi:hypothetical protein